MSTATRVTVEPDAAATPVRRKHSILEKRRMVEETFVAGASVARVAREHGVNANLVFSWRRLYQRGMLGGNPPAPALLPVKVTEPTTLEPAAATAPVGSIQLRLPKGQIRIEGAVDPASLRIILECLLA